jgi:flagellar motor switch protein FliM
MNIELSKDEHQALLDAMKATQDNQSSNEIYNTQVKKLERLIPRLSKNMDEVASFLGSKLNSFLKKSCSIQTHYSVIKFWEKLESDRENYIFFLIKDNNENSNYLSLSYGSAFLLIETQFGGVCNFDSENRELINRKLTLIEKEILLSIIHKWIYDLFKKHEKENSFKLYYLNQELENSGKEKSEVFISCDFKFMIQQVEINFYLFIYDKPLVFSQDKDKNRSKNYYQPIAQHFSNTALEITVILGYYEISLNDLIYLKVNDIFWLNQLNKDPLPVFIEDRILFRAFPHVVEDRLTVKIVEG